MDGYRILPPMLQGRTNKSDPRSLPLVIEIRGSEVLKDVIPAYIMDIFGNLSNAIEICRHVRSLEWISSLNCGVVAQTYDFADIVGSTQRPTPMPTIGMPTRRPTVALMMAKRAALGARA